MSLRAISGEDTIELIRRHRRHGWLRKQRRPFQSSPSGLIEDDEAGPAQAARSWRPCHTDAVGNWRVACRRPRQRGPAAVLRWLSAGAGMFAAAATLRPRSVGLAGTPGFLHVVALRGMAALGFAGVALAGLATLTMPGRGRPSIRIAFSGVCAAVAAAHAATVIHRGWAGRDRPGPTDLVVVSFNTERMRATAAQVTRLVLDSGADVVVLLETPRAAARAIVESLTTIGHRFDHFVGTDGLDPADTTVLLVRHTLGPYRQTAAPFMLHGAVRVEPVDAEETVVQRPVLVAVHPGAPVPAVGFAAWRRYVAAALALGQQNAPVIVAGDFNTTLDQSPLRDLGRLMDCAAAVGRGAEGTWPSWLPVALAAPIDHILVSRGDFTVVGTSTLRVGRSDHRALMAKLALTVREDRLIGSAR